MITRPSFAVGKYGTLEFLGKMAEEGSFIFTLDRDQRLPYMQVKHVLDQFSDDWLRIGLNEHFNLVFVLKTEIKRAETPELLLPTNMEIIARKLADKLDTIRPQIMMARQMADTEIVSEPISPQFNIARSTYCSGFIFTFSVPGKQTILNIILPANIRKMDGPQIASQRVIRRVQHRLVPMHGEA